MEYTKFGEWMRIRRVQHRECMSDSARLLGVTTAFISAAESGKRNVPDNWMPILSMHYGLSEEEQNELFEIVALSKTQFKLDLTSASQTKRRLCLLLQSSFDELDDDTANTLIKVLEGKERMKNE